MELQQLLQQVQNGTMSIGQATDQLKNLPYENMDFARLDYHRQLRRGFPEVIFCKGKTCEQTAAIFSKFAQHDNAVLATKATQEQYHAVLAVCPQAVFHQAAQIISYSAKPIEHSGKVVVCTGGTADIPIAEEAALTASFFGANVVRIFDVGVAGIHRLFDALPQIEDADAIIAVAGMEGALPGVLAGLINRPVIAVPTSVGYGASFGGLSALLTMLNSCAEGVSVVNIDNGYGAGYIAAQNVRMRKNGTD